MEEWFDPLLLSYLASEGMAGQGRVDLVGFQKRAPRTWKSCLLSRCLGRRESSSHVNWQRPYDPTVKFLVDWWDIA